MTMKDGNILTNRFVELIEENHQQITEAYMNDLLRNPDTISYRNLDRQLVYESGDRIYRDLSKWIVKQHPKGEVEKHYTKVGRERFEQGIPFPQAYKSLVLQRRHLWVFILDKMHYDVSVYKDAMDLSNRVLVYFDRAAFSMLKGYEDMIYKKW
jgi:hypothetical protein